MAYVTYGEARLYPSPLYSLTSTINKTGDGTPISVNYDITLTGTLLPSRGNPKNDGTFDALDGGPDGDGISADTTAETTSDLKFKSLLLKQQALTDLFNQDGQKLEIFHDGGGAAKYTGYPEVVNVSFDSAVTVDRTNYTITLRGIELIGTKLTYPEAIDSAIKANMESLTESFSLTKELDVDSDGGEVKVYSVSHTASGSARQSYQRGDTTLPGPDGTGDEDPPDVRAYENVRSVLHGLIEASDFSANDTNLAGFLLNSSEEINVAQYRVTEDVTSENGDYYSGTYSVTRTLKLREIENGTDGSAAAYISTHDYTVDVQMNTPNLKSLQSANALLGYVNNYTINGTIQGIRGKIGDSIKTAYQSADLAFAAIIQDDDYTKVIGLINKLIPNNTNLIETKSIPKTSTVSRNKRQGSISYSFNFIEKPSAINTHNDSYFVDYDINVNETHDDDKIAVIPILGRAHGPIIQNLNTTGLYTRSITGTFVLQNNGRAGYNDANPYEWDDIGEIRVKAIDLIQAQPADLLDGGQGTRWWVTGWNDGLDVFNGIYNINLTLSVVRNADTKDITSSGWMSF